MFKNFKKQQGVGMLVVLRLHVQAKLSKENWFKKQIDSDIKDLINSSVQTIKYAYNTLLKRKNIFVIYLKQIKHVRGKKIIFNKPLNGQRTHTNAKTVKKLFIKNKI